MNMDPYEGTLNRTKNKWNKMICHRNVWKPLENIKQDFSLLYNQNKQHQNNKMCSKINSIETHK